MNLFQAIIIAIVEGLTEFLPISSTGHMIIASSAFGIGHEDFTKIFEVAIQLGAILAVVVLYWRKFFHFTRWQFYLKLMVSVIPALFFGFLFNDFIDQMLGSPVIVAVSLVVGGIVLLFVDKWFPQSAQSGEPDILAHHLTRQEVVEAEEKLSYKKSFIIGFWQVLAMIPGVSRSAASIIGGMQQKLSRNFAAEFSFFLAVPTMFAATIYSLVMKDWGEGEQKQKGYEVIMASQENIIAFAVGNIVAFVVALLAIRFFITYLQKHGFRLFGWYRIVAGIILLALAFAGYLT
ncbi:MAG TPA: undecaprenyl-diphosphate phosphatase [Flavisolibacter sp.]|jgi:undecaprenyl-diphosphatase|nr:undecaprenyl-diphosphate phosphatase [Flavisolibacter sp.]